jgi:hypothetical protein
MKRRRRISREMPNESPTISYRKGKNGTAAPFLFLSRPIYDLREAAITFLTACSPALQFGPHEARRGSRPDVGQADSSPTPYRSAAGIRPPS